MTYVEKVLYDPVDNRHNLYEPVVSDKVREQAKSVALFVKKDALIQLPLTNTYIVSSLVPTFQNYIFDIKNCPLGEYEKFANEPVLGYGTGFLISDKMILTAGHVAEHSNIHPTYIVFGYQMEDLDHPVTIFEHKDVYTIKKQTIIGDSLRSGEDWALVKLDRKVEGCSPLTLSHIPGKQGQELYMLGYPRGLPNKYTNGASITNLTPSNHFEAKVDAYQANSGSPIFRADSGEVVGILCNGNEDFKIDHNYMGTGYPRCVSNNLSGKKVESYEKCQRINDSMLTHVGTWSSGFRMFKCKSRVQFLSPGLRAISRCTNSGCSLFKNDGWILHGLGVFHLENVLHKFTNCNACHRPLEVVDVGLTNCRYILEGELVEPKNVRIHKESSVAKGVLKKLDPRPEYVFRYLTISVKAIV